MIIERYGITLKSLGVEDLETVRVWRNSDLVRPYMFYQEIISKSEQESWFSKLEPLNDFYFIIEYKQKPIGLINLKNIDWQETLSNSAPRRQKTFRRKQDDDGFLIKFKINTK